MSFNGPALPWPLVGVVAEEAYRRFADDPDPATAAVVRHRAAFHRAFDAPAAGLSLME